MKKLKIFILWLIAILAWTPASSQEQEISDSALIAAMKAQLDSAQAVHASMQMEIESLKFAAEKSDSLRRDRIRQRIDSIRSTTQGTLVIVDEDTLFAIYARHGGLNPQSRAAMATREITRIGKMFSLQPDSVFISANEMEADIMYDEDIIMSVNELDGVWAGLSRDSLALQTRDIIVNELRELKSENHLFTLIRRILSLCVAVLALVLVIKFINMGYRRVRKRIQLLAETRFKPLCLQNLELLSVHRQVRLLNAFVYILRIALIIIVILLVAPLLFSIFPQTELIAHKIFEWVWQPCRQIIIDVVSYIPNLITICVIIIAIKYLVRLIKYFARQLAAETLKINGFYPDWAMPTFYIVRFLLYAFMVAMIYPYLPGADSGVFQGISVFVGLIVSIGSSSAIGNIIAGLVITYMRPFRPGDRVEIKDTTGDVIEKTPFVTRIRTIKNEVVTIPNSFIMSSQTINYSRSAKQYGLIIHTEVNVSYSEPWRKIYDLLIEAALATRGVVDDPRPFVLQTTLGNDYCVYQINAYIHDANLLPDVYSDLHASIQNIFNRAGIEILSPHYISTRDGSPSTLRPE